MTPIHSAGRGRPLVGIGTVKDPSPRYCKAFRKYCIIVSLLYDDLDTHVIEEHDAKGSGMVPEPTFGSCID